MTMKKRFLGLALAAAVALPATSAYAADKTITGNDTATLEHNVTVSGSVTRADGTAAQGKITVELPTTMTFGVDQSSNFTGCEFNVKNKSSVGVDVLVSELRNANNAITVKSKSELTSNLSNFDRSNVYLELSGSVGGQATTVDLSTANGISDQKVLNVGANSSGLITLNGGAGTKKYEDNLKAGTVNENGASGEFTLVFKVKKDSK